jgi:hypothetical protein
MSISSSNKAVPFAMQGGSELRQLTEEEIQQVAGGTVTAHYPQDGVTKPTFDND